MFNQYPVYLLTYDIYHSNQFTDFKPYSCIHGVCKNYDTALHWHGNIWLNNLLEDHRMVWIDEIPVFDPFKEEWSVPNGKPDLNLLAAEAEALEKRKIEKTKKGQITIF